MRLRKAVFFAALSAGCAARVQVDTPIAGAHAVTPRGESRELPATFRVGLPALRAHRIRIEATGYRTVSLDVGRATAWASGFPPWWAVGRPASVTVLLVPEHPPIGSVAEPSP